MDHLRVEEAYFKDSYRRRGRQSFASPLSKKKTDLERKVTKIVSGKIPKHNGSLFLSVNNPRVALEKVSIDSLKKLD